MKIKEMINGMGINDLKLIESGMKDSRGFRKLVKDKIERLELKQNKVCVVCGEKIGNNECFALMFKSEGIERKASFCAIDCLGYFVSKLKGFQKIGVQNGK